MEFYENEIGFSTRYITRFVIIIIKINKKKKKSIKQVSERAVLSTYNIITKLDRT